jgi:hypothetical protein
MGARATAEDGDVDRAARWAPFVALVAVRVVIAVVIVAGPWTDEASELDRWDVDRFHEIATSPGQAYVDFDVEYPPVYLGLLEALDAPALTDAIDRYVVANLGFDLVVALALVSLGGRRAVLAYLAVGLFLLPLLYLPLDLASVACAVGATALVAKRHLRTGGAVLAVGVLTKLWPVLLVPALFSRARRRAAVWFAGVLAAGTAAWLAWAGLDSPKQVATFRGATGWHVESALGALVALVDGVPARYDAGSFRVGTAPLVVKVVLLAAVAAVALVAWRRARGQELRAENLAVLTSVAALLAASPLLSPQFLVWLAPWAALAWAWGDRRVAGAGFAAIALTGVTLAGFGPDGLDHPVPLLLLTARNGLLVTTAVLGLIALGACAPRELSASAVGRAPVRSPA